MSRRFAIISHDSNKDYSFFAPIVEWCWKELSWEVITLDADKIKAVAPGLQKYPSGLISQCCRLYAAQLFDMNEDDYLMTSDVDMIPLGQFNQYYVYNRDLITSFGKDLTDHHYPICYIGMKVKKWREVMKLNGLTMAAALERDLADYKNHWTTDQDIITERLKEFSVDVLPRGVYPNGLALGRLDRSGWEIRRERIDCHAVRPGYTPENWVKIRTAISHSFDYVNKGNWMNEYVRKFQ